MSYAIVVSNFISLAGLLAAGAFGYAVLGALTTGAEPATVATHFSRHLLLALASTILAMFGQSMVFFYFIGTGKSIKTAVEMYKLDPEYAQRTRAFKSEVYPPALWALLLVMAAFVIGGGAASRAVAGWLHHLLAWAAVLTHAWASVVGARAIRANMSLLQELDRVIAGLSRQGKVQVKRAVV